MRIDHPTLWAGLDTTADVDVLYTLRQSNTGAVTFSRPVSSRFTAKAAGFGEAFGAALEAGSYSAVDPKGLGRGATARLQTQMNARPLQAAGLADEGPGPLNASDRVRVAASNALRLNVAQFFAWVVGGAPANAVAVQWPVPSFLWVGAAQGTGTRYFQPGYYLGGVLHRR